MDVLLIGGAGSLIDALIAKFSGERHRVYLLTGQKHDKSAYKHVFERYDFPYSGENVKDIIEGIYPDIVIHTGAFDTNYDWSKARDESVRYESELINILTMLSLQKKGRFVYFSSNEVFENTYADNIPEDEPISVSTFKGMAVAQGEEICENHRKNFGTDVMILRFDHLYSIPQKRGGQESNPVFQQCLEAVKTGRISANERRRFSMISQSDAVEQAYRVIMKEKPEHHTYHITSMEEINELKLAKMIESAAGKRVEAVDATVGEGRRIVLDGRRFREEFPAEISVPYEKGVSEYVKYMKKNRMLYVGAVDAGAEKKALWRAAKKAFAALVPFIENIIFFFPVYWLGGMTDGLQLFEMVDFYFLYVLVFAIIHGQQQAVFSAILALVGYIFGSANGMTAFETLIDYSTYVWAAQLFIMGTAVGYIKDRLRNFRAENAEETLYLREQIEDIENISDSNAHIKRIFKNELVNQQDSLGKVYKVISGLDRRQPEEVLIYATEVVSKLMDTKDVATYTVVSEDYARLISFTSRTAQKLGTSVKYSAMSGMYDDLMNQCVFINRKMYDNYPVMALGIYESNSLKQILMLWSIPWDRMNLSEINRLKIIGLLIQNKIVQSQHYLEATKEARYEKDSNILNQAEFSKLLKIYRDASKRNLVSCLLFRIIVDDTPEEQKIACETLEKYLYDTDYIGVLEDGRLYALFTNTDESMEAFIAEKFIRSGYSYIRKDLLEI